MTAKELAKLAKACRAAGIKTYKDKDIEFTLTDEVPVKQSKAKQAKIDFSSTASEIEAVDTWESLSDEEKLFYSVNPGALETPSEQ